jgi:agmatinase
MSESLESYSPVLDRDLEDLALADLGDLPLAGCSMDESIERIASATALALRQYGFSVMIGGEHTASLGGVRGAVRVFPNLHVLHVDAHLDFRQQYDGQSLTHASWLYHAGAEIGFERI